MLTSLSYTMRGRPFVVVGLWVTSMSPLVITSDLSVSCFLLTHVYYLTSSVFSPDHLTCHYLAKPVCYVMTYPDYYLSLIMFSCLLNIIILSCYHLTPSMIYLTLWLSCLRESCLVIMELSATRSKVPHHTRWGPPLESVGLFLLCPVIPIIW